VLSTPVTLGVALQAGSQGSGQASFCTAFGAGALSVAKPAATSIDLFRALLETLSVSFAPADALPFAPPLSVTPPEPLSSAQSIESPACPSYTRIKPPGELVKLEDRLFYVLQPAIENLVANGTLALPLRPFPYQLEGVAFLVPRYSAILADEMGLGKTMQAITALRMLIHSGQVRSALLVCPKPLVTSWRRELAHWAPELPTAIIEGQPEQRRWHWSQPGVPLKIANYELLQRDQEVLADPAVRFDLVILDEAQRIKNRTSATSQLVRSIARRRSWALTGTPIENSPDDLVGIFEFLAPGYLSSDMTPRGMAKAAGQYVLRRTKDKVLQSLPPKMIRDAQVQLTPAQRQTYLEAEEQGIVRLTELGPAATIHHVFELVLRLKQICNFDPPTGSSAKLERLEADVEEIAASGAKALVFSQWVSTLETIAGRLARFRPLQYHGRVDSRHRDEVIEEFRSGTDRPLLLVSYGAGGVGLNLQFANYVFLFDRWWNPAVEDQAINRAHRIGGCGPVTVTRFLTLDTIEERIDQVLTEKRALFDMVFSNMPDEAPAAGLSQQEIFGLFKLRCPSGPVKLVA